MTTILPYLLPVFQQPPLTNTELVTLSMIITGLLLILLIEKEFIRAYGTVNIRIWLNALNNFSWALFGVFMFLIFMRFLGFYFK